MKKLASTAVLMLLFTCLSCSNKPKNPIPLDDVSPWCIVSFDSLERSPKARIAMLQEMGFSKYGYDWEDEDLDEMKEEFELAKENNIEISSVFLWLNAQRDSIGKLSPSNERMFEILEEVAYKPTLWLSFSNNFFEELNQEESMTLAIAFINFIKMKADKLGCKIALYNHHGWFGNPHNQVEIIEALAQDSLKMVYNFHHAHNYLDEFPEIVKKIKPYLSNVNINGMKKGGPQILTIGEGDLEYNMVKLLLDQEFNGSWGILGHIETENVQHVLERNIKGLNSLNAKYQLEIKNKSHTQQTNN